MSFVYEGQTVTKRIEFSGTVTGTPTAQLYVDGVANGSPVNGTGSGAVWVFAVNIPAASVGAWVDAIASGVVSGVTQTVEIVAAPLVEVYSLTAITNSSPVADSGTLTGPIVIEDDYLASQERAFVWYINPLDITFATSTAKVGGVDEAGNTWLVTGTMTEVTVDGDPKWKLSFSLDDDDTSVLDVGKARYSVAVYATTGEQITVARGSVQVVRAYTT